MRVIGPKHQLWTPRAYQEAGVEHLCKNSSAALFYDPGLGKTSTTLAAFKLLQEHGVAHRALVIAPVRVCQLVWEQEAAGWTQFRDLRFANMAAKSAQTRANQLQANADIWLINPESVAWLTKQFQFSELPFDTLIIDELTKFKNSRAKRSKLLQPLADRIHRRWGLTGSPAANGYEDLFGEMKILDGGAALGQYITQYRDKYFTKGHDGFNYELRPGADVLIQDRLRPYVHALRAEDYLNLPPLLPHIIKVEPSPAVMAQYRLFKKQMVLDLPDGSVTAVNAAALYNKLTQFTGGAVYTADGAWSRVHDAKLDALEDLVEELSGQQLLVAYHYGHELERLLERFPWAKYIGGGVSERAVREIEEEWNSGKLKLLFGHPASMGHGLNMQKSGASHICWFTLTWDFELFDQFIKRILRQGTTAEKVVNHMLVVEGTIDNILGDSVSMKGQVQDGLLDALKAELIKDDPESARVFKTGEADMRRVVVPGGQAPAQNFQPAQPPQTQAPANTEGWGAPPQSQAPKTDVRELTQQGNAGWGGVAPQNAQKQEQESKVAGPAGHQQLSQAAQQGGWATQTFQQEAAQVRDAIGLPPVADTGAAPETSNGFAALEALQQAVLQPGELQPQFNISSGNEDRVETNPLQRVAAGAAQNSAASNAPAANINKPRAKKAAKAEVAPFVPNISFDIGSYIAQRIASGGVDFITAQNEAAQIVESLSE